MKLFWAPPSPYARKVRVTIAEKGLGTQVELLSVSITPLVRNPAVAASNPLGKIPCLIRDDGSALFDSRVITRYLDGLAETPRLYPQGDGLFETLKWEALADGGLDAAVSCVYEKRCRDEAQQSPAWLDAQRVKITAALDAFEADGMARLSVGLDAAAIATGCLLAYLDFRTPVPDWRPGRPTLEQWFETFSERPSMQNTQPA